MKSKRGRLDRFVSRRLNVSCNQVRVMLAKSQVRVDGKVAKDRDLLIDEFAHICVDEHILQDNQPRYVMLHKPIGVVSATRDDQHKTVIDCLGINYVEKGLASSLEEGLEKGMSADENDLHIVGRLDLNTSGLVLLTNDGRWSKALMSPENKVEKVYRVTLQNPLTQDYIDAFANGMYFAYEDITTLPVKLEIQSEYVAMVTLMEGRYHQIKRMFGRFRNPVLALHRLSVGHIVLEPSLLVGQSRRLSQAEVQL
ncbi:pseudouridine synthase [Shewanella surugensis]|uniref:Pseudouridine synthase n=1 Tax=Shewanella surugensis TaxID=212020 RepID=A0ABT0L8B0_9GAMM|nr:16S rRNA pseudouridine(516) synthase [Shewanella surugensis]MCL1123789.1 pseudouridine synthase [Shewanella surugensis]